MSTHLFREGDLAVLRTNRFVNPSFETDAAGVTYSGDNFAFVDTSTYGVGAPWVLSGESSIYWALTSTPTATTSLAQDIAGPLEGGQWVAVCIPVQPYEWNGRVQVKIYPDAPAVGEGTIIAAPADTWAYPVATYQLPGGVSAATAHLFIYGASADTPDADAEGDTDAWIAAVADTEAEALAALTPYFDGDTPGSVFTQTSYAWTGEPHASTSTESTATGVVSPNAVLNYEHETDTGVTAHRPAHGGAPLIVRRTFATPPSGTFEFLAVDLASAEDIAAMCDGRTNVELWSDDLPGAPFLFTPTDAGRVRWNTPYSSWTVYVPYARLT